MVLMKSNATVLYRLYDEHGLYYAKRSSKIKLDKCRGKSFGDYVMNVTTQTGDIVRAVDYSNYSSFESVGVIFFQAILFIVAMLVEFFSYVIFAWCMYARINKKAHKAEEDLKRILGKYA